MINQCYRPTVLNVYEYGEKKIIRRHYWKEYKNLINHLYEPNTYKTIKLSKKEQEKYEIKIPKILVKVKYSDIIPCGQCEACLKTRSKHLTNRIILDVQETNTIPYLITLTYNDENLPDPPQLSKKDAKDFITKVKKDYPKTKYLLAGEYGSHNGRPHYHVLIWNIKNLETKIKPYIPREQGKSYITYEATSEYWTKGNIYISSNAQPGTVQYVAQYAEKKRMRSKEEKEAWKEQGLIPEFQMMTKGIAYNYYETHYKKIIQMHGKYIDKTGYEKTVEKSFIDWYKRRYGDLDSKTLYEKTVTTYIPREDNGQLREQREKNAHENTKQLRRL